MRLETIPLKCHTVACMKWAKFNVYLREDGRRIMHGRYCRRCADRRIKEHDAWLDKEKQYEREDFKDSR